MNKDVTFGIAWSVGLVVVMVGAFVLESTINGSEEYQVSWQDQPKEILAEGATFTEGQREEYVAKMSGHRMRAVDVEFTWQDGVGQNDVFRVDVLDPEGVQRASSSSSTGEISLQVPVRSVETSKTEAVSEEGAIRNEEPAWEYGEMTDWTIVVTLVSAPGTTGLTPLQDQADGQQSFDVTVTALYVKPMAVVASK